MVAERGYPQYLRSDNGREFVSTVLLEWASKHGMTNMLIQPGKPWQNGTNENFNGKLKDECLAMNWFHSRKHAKVLIEQWRERYNTIRLHSSLDSQTPLEYVSGSNNSSDLLPTSRTKVMEQSPLISENSGYETIQIYR